MLIEDALPVPLGDVSSMDDGATGSSSSPPRIVRHLLYLTFVEMTVGGFAVLNKALFSGAHPIEPLTFCLLRNAFAAIISFALFQANPLSKRPELRDAMTFFFSGLTGNFFSHYLFAIGIKLTSPFVAAIFQVSKALPMLSNVRSKVCQ